MISILLKKALFLLMLVALVLVLGGIGGVFFERFVVPRLAASSYFGSMEFFREANERVTIINRTEQVVIREDDTVERIVSQPATAVVNIVALPEIRDAGGSTASLGAAAETVATTTGVLLTNDGLVATYSEIAFDTANTEYSILLFDGSIHQAAFVGRDRLTNLSFFRISATPNTPAIAFANSDDARVGRRLIAIGNTFAEYQNRLAVGLLSNINRIFNLSGKTVASSEKWEGVFEMDLARPESFVGGPVIGFNGEMVGIVGTLTINNTLQSFVIPSNVVRDALNRLVAGTLENRPVLGTYYLSITKALALGQGLSRDRGALIYSRSGSTGLALLADSPAMKAGLQANDIIMSVNGVEVNLDNPLSELIARFSIGDTITLIVLRSGTERTIEVKL